LQCSLVHYTSSNITIHILDKRNMKAAGSSFPQLAGMLFNENTIRDAVFSRRLYQDKQPGGPVADLYINQLCYLAGYTRTSNLAVQLLTYTSTSWYPPASHGLSRA